LKNKDNKLIVIRATIMFYYLQKNSLFSSLRSVWNWLVLLPIILAAIYITSGCNSISRQYFEDFGLAGGLSVEKPDSWQAEFDKRNETVVLKGKRGLRGKDSALIVIQPFTTLPTSSPLAEHLEATIDAINTQYNLGSVTVTQEPVVIEYEDYETATTTISIPTSSIPAGSTANQVGSQEPGIFQTIGLHAIRCDDNFALVRVYSGNSEQLNSEAESIVKSIELTCSR